MSRRYWSSVDERKEAIAALNLVQVCLMFTPILNSNSSAHMRESAKMYGDFTFLLMVHAFSLMSKITTPIVDESIPFGDDPPLLEDFNESQCILDFRFRKEELREIMDGLYPRMILFFNENSTYESIKCENRYVCPFETGFLIMLARLSRPRRLRPDLERMFHIRKSKLSACQMYVLCCLSLLHDAFYLD